MSRVRSDLSYHLTHDAEELAVPALDERLQPPEPLTEGIPLEHLRLHLLEDGQALDLELPLDREARAADVGQHARPGHAFVQREQALHLLEHLDHLVPLAVDGSASETDDDHAGLLLSKS